MLSPSAILDPIREDLIKVEDSLDSISRAHVGYLSELLAHSLGSGGKRIRPTLTLLSGRFYSYDLDCLLPMAVAVELLHTASLVHDDIIDKSAVRRGQPTVYEVWGQDKAILVGDYLFAKAGAVCATTGNLRVIRLFSQTLVAISIGELQEAFSTFNLEQTREQYLDRISNKTASLFILAAESGAVLSQAPERSIEILREYGHNLGIAFQIVDDILDFVGTEKEMGKPIGSDLVQGTLTLPAMLLLERYPKDNPVAKLFRNRGMPEAEKQEKIRQAIELVRGSPIVKECFAVAADYSAKACSRLNLLPDSPSCQALKDLADLVINRRK